MSSTISVGRRAAAFRANDVIYYALFETTFESNVSPKTPRECCVAFGTAAQVNAWILKAMASCVSGCLRRPGADFTPDGYLRSWRSALTAPLALLDRDITITPDRDTLAAMRKHGYTTQAALLEQGLDCVLRLHADAGAAADLIGERSDGTGPAPWRVIQPRSFGDADPALALKTASRTGSPVPFPDIYTTGLTRYHDRTPLFAIRHTDGCIVFIEEWNLKTRLLTCQAFEAELAGEGTGMAMAQRILSSGGIPAESLPDSAVLIYQLKGTHEDYVTEFMAAVTPFGTASEDRMQFTITMGSARVATEEARQQLGVLDTRATILLPKNRPAQVSNTRSDPQPDLFSVAA
ncbi:MAG: hypothetical protein ACREPQ_14255 [Rhodanobacter sp.]